MANPLRKYVESHPKAGSVRDARIFVAPQQSVTSTPSYEAYRTLQFGFVAAPVIAGLDKFFSILTNWDRYLAPAATNLFNVEAHTFMQVAGVVEIVAGIGVALRPRVFAYVVCLWLIGIIVNLLLTGQYYDIALRDLGLALGAFALGRLAQTYDLDRVRLRTQR